jgi:hypothetical protein
MDTNLHWWRDQDAHWYRGNLHTHTTGSDGRLSPAQACEWYQGQGYHFVQLADHDVITRHTAFAPGRFLCIPSAEIQGATNQLGQPYHFLALGLDDDVPLPTSRSAQTIIDAIRSAGAEVIIAHPYWSGHTVGDLLPLSGYLGLEVWNTLCELLNGKGHSGIIWDDLLARGRRLLAVACDDAHWELQDHGHGWVMVRARQLRQADILAALRRGQFYSSTGPAIYDLRVDGRTVWVSCSEVAAINFVSESAHGQCLRVGGGQLLLEGEATLPDSATYVRIECIDARGRRAWTNPVFFD